MICDICPRRCGALRDETHGEGVCQMPALPVAARAALHFWEEPPISGTRGSGAVFFSGCPLKCAFCQNEAISHENFGRPISPARLREIFRELIAQGAHNINLVNPTHFSHVLVEVLAEPLPVPVVWNSGGYERVETLRTLEGKVQIYLPDLKYMSGALARTCSAAPDYPDHVAAAIAEMVRQTGPYELDGDGLLKKGVVIRHLILPGHVAEAKAVMDWVAETFPPHTVLFSLMSQYVPMGRAKAMPGLGRRVRGSEARSAEEYMSALGLEGFVQDRASASGEFIPAFDLTGV